MKWFKGMRYGWVAGLFALCIHWFGPATFMEKVYGGAIFPFFAWILDHTIGLLPFSFLYVLVILIFLGLYFFSRYLKRSDLRKGKFWLQFLYSLLSWIGWLFFIFYCFWGFNYDRIQLKERLTWHVEKVDDSTFLKEGRDQAIRLASFNLTDRETIQKSLIYRHFILLEEGLRLECLRLARQLGYLDRKRVRCRHLKPDGILLRLSTAGFYNPLTGECNMDAGLHPLQKPFVMAHEFFHGLGVTGEGDCNFLAYLVCHQSDHPYIRYSGELGYWRYMRYALYRTDEKVYEEIRSSLPETVHEDLQAIEDQMDKFPDFAPKMRDAIYTAYLKSNKIEDGMANYSRILQLVINWRINGQKL